MVAVSTTTGRSIRETKAYQAYESFLKSKEGKELLKSKDFLTADERKNLDLDSAQDLLKLRNYMYDKARRDRPADKQSVDFIRVEIGAIVEPYKKMTAIEKENRREQNRLRHKPRQVTINPYAPLSKIPYGRTLRA